MAPSCGTADLRGIRRATGALTLVAALLIGGCTGGTHTATDGSGLPTARAITRADVARLSEANLRFPGATVVKRVGMDQTPNGDPEDPDPAYTGAILTAKATPGQLFAWYDSTLTQKGFVPALYFRPGDQTSGKAWQFRHRLQLQVGVFDPVLLHASAGISPKLSPGEIVYQAVLVGYLPGLPKY